MIAPTRGFDEPDVQATHFSDGHRAIAAVIGGGVISDIAGFAALLYSITKFKDQVNIPTIFRHGKRFVPNPYKGRKKKTH